MRQLFVIEIQDVHGVFHPKMGFDRLDLLEKWIGRYLAEPLKMHPDQWRIVTYVPKETEALLVQ